MLRSKHVTAPTTAHEPGVHLLQATILVAKLILRTICALATKLDSRAGARSHVKRRDSAGQILILNLVKARFPHHGGQ
jgi:hypothetical protein